MVSNNQLAAQMSRQSPERLDVILHKSGGAIGTALKELALLSEGKSSSENSVTRVLGALKDKNRVDVLTLINEVCSSREEAEQFLTTFRSALRDMMIIKSHSDADVSLGQADILEDYAFRLSVNRILTLDMKIESMIFDLEYFPNISSFKLGVYKTLWDGLR